MLRVYDWCLVQAKGLRIRTQCFAQPSRLTLRMSRAPRGHDRTGPWTRRLHSDVSQRRGLNPLGRSPVSGGPVQRCACFIQSSCADSLEAIGPVESTTQFTGRIPARLSRCFHASSVWPSRISTSPSSIPIACAITRFVTASKCSCKTACNCSNSGHNVPSTYDLATLTITVV